MFPESRLGVKVFDRTSRRVRLTSGGEELKRNLVPARAPLDQALADTSQLSHDVRGLLRVGFVLTARAGDQPPGPPHPVPVRLAAAAGCHATAVCGISADGQAQRHRRDRRLWVRRHPGSFPANAAWLACAAITGNLLRAAGALASLAFAKARRATIRRDLVNVAARTARHGRGHLALHLPEGWHRDQEWFNLFEAAQR